MAYKFAKSISRYPKSKRRPQPRCDNRNPVPTTFSSDGRFNLIYGVGEDEDHPLSAAMTLVGTLIKVYEDEHFPKLVDLFPEPAEEI